MALHLIKLSVGPESLSDLANWQAQRLRGKKRKGETPELIHITRNTPKRAAELLAGGSIYWVIKGFICARQRLLELRPLVRNGTPHCGLVYDKELVRVKLRPHRAFQGWRYLESKDAPPDLAKGQGEDTLPEDMRRQLTELGLL
jgi:hypothetical protein